MKLIAEIEGEKLPVEWRREGARVFAEVDGRSYEIEAVEAEPGVYLLFKDGAVCEAHVGDGATEERRNGPNEIRVRYLGRQTAYAISLADPKRLRGARAAGGEHGGRARILAPMPGKVVRVIVEEGQAVEAGASVVVVEAMKMQNELKSPKAGTVVELHARAGETVNAGQVLAVIE